MKTSYSLLYEYQSQLVYGCLEDFCTCCAISQNADLEEIRNETAYLPTDVIDFHYLNVITGLTEIDANSINNDLSAEALHSKLQEIYDTLFWHATFFVSTKKTELLAQKYDLCSWEGFNKPLHQEFMNSVIKIYSDYDALTLGCDEATAHQRITVAKRVILKLMHP
jgi:hypothetical protein